MTAARPADRASRARPGSPSGRSGASAPTDPARAGRRPRRRFRGSGRTRRSAAAAAETADQLDALAGRLRDMGREEEAAIFDAQSMMALDPGLVEDAIRRTGETGDPVEGVRAAAAAAAELLAALDDEILAARAADVRDVGARICRVLRARSLDLPAVPSIAVCDDLPPSVTAEIPPGFLLGIALAGGSRRPTR